MLKLFRDYLFHQVSEDGRPWLDMSHVVQCLNKLDTGAPEKVGICFSHMENCDLLCVLKENVEPDENF
jgi:PAB-dependent poly(A)-specific ribonuclease subunit 3